MRSLWFSLGLLSLIAAFALPLLTSDTGAMHQAFLLGLAICCALLWILSRRPRPKPGKRQAILIDGSNVLHWRGGIADIATVADLVRSLEETGYRPGVVFDANIGYKIADRFLNDRQLAKVLALPVKQILVAPKGTPADAYLLQAARDMDAPIITNDRFRDWAEDFPELTQESRLIQGGYRDGTLYLKHP